ARAPGRDPGAGRSRRLPADHAQVLTCAPAVIPRRPVLREDGATFPPGGTMAASFYRRTWFRVAVALAAVLFAAWAVAALRGPALPGYDVAAGPLVQDVV